MTKMESIKVNPNVEISLDQVPIGEGGWISKMEGPDPVIQRMLEVGIMEGAYVELVHEAPFGKDPIAIRVRGALVALRRAEAKYICVQRVPKL